MKLTRPIIAALACLMLAPGSAIAAGESCGANATETGRSESNGRVTLTCKCNDGHVEGADGCVRASRSVIPRFRLRNLYLTGTVSFALPDGTRIDARAARARLLPPGTRIATGAGSIAILTFADGSTVRLLENSVFAIEAPPGVLGFAYRLAAGALDFVDSHSARGQIRTPYAVATVRGTAFLMTTDSRGTRISLRSGLVDLLGRDGAVLLTLRPGQVVDVAADGTVGSPRPVS